LTTPRPPSVWRTSSTLSIGSPMNLSPPLLLEREEAALDRADRRRRDVAVVSLELLRIVGRELQQRAQVFEVEEQQSAVVRDFEHQRKNARLRLVEVQHARKAAAARDR